MNEIKMIKKVVGAEFPAESHYRIALNGVFLALDTDWVTAIVPEKSHLQIEKPIANLKLPLPGIEVFLPVLAFFSHIYKLHHAEAAVLLHFDMKAQKWAISVPEQEVSMASVHYDMTERIPGHRCVGTMHSHGHMIAGHSGVDRHDEQTFDGLHITIGIINQLPRFDIDAELIVHEYPFKIKATDFPCIKEHTTASVPSTDRWIPPWRDVISPRYTLTPRHTLMPPSRFVLDRITEQELFDYPIPEEWVNRVRGRYHIEQEHHDHI